jgi:hypothetical protein
MEVVTGGGGQLEPERQARERLCPVEIINDATAAAAADLYIEISGDGTVLEYPGMA